MITAKFSNPLRAIVLDSGIPSGSVVGHSMLMSGGVASAAITDVNAATNVFTSTINLPVGSRIRLAGGVGGVLPSPLVASVDYFVIPGTPTTFSLAVSKAAAIDGTVIDITDIGSLPINCNEQPITVDSPIAQIVGKEVSASVTGYVRKPVQFQAATITGDNVQKPAVPLSWTTGATPIDYLAWVVIWGGEVAFGSTVGDGVIFGSDGSGYQIAANNSGGITIRVSQA